MELENTKQLEKLDVTFLRALVAEFIHTDPHAWRHHGIGVLQKYLLHPKLVDTYRVHVWHPALVAKGIRTSGNVHNHRFSFTSVVLHGTLKHKEHILREVDPENRGGFHTDELPTHYLAYDFLHARLHTDENRADMSRLPHVYAVKTQTYFFETGDQYWFRRGAYHQSEALGPVTVTLVKKEDEQEERARVIAPWTHAPVPAFAWQAGPDVIRAVIDEAIDALTSLY